MGTKTPVYFYSITYGMKWIELWVYVCIISWHFKP